MNNFSLLRFFITIIDILEWTIIVRVILSYIVTNRDNVIIDTIFTITDILFTPARILLNKLGLDRGFFDWSPFLSLIFLGILSNIMVRIF